MTKVISLGQFIIQKQAEPAYTQGGLSRRPTNIALPANIGNRKPDCSPIGNGRRSETLGAVHARSARQHKPGPFCRRIKIDSATNRFNGCA